MFLHSYSHRFAISSNPTISLLTAYEPPRCIGAQPFSSFASDIHTRIQAFIDGLDVTFNDSIVK